MTEPLPEPTPPTTTYPAPSTDDPGVARRNMIWGWALFGLFWALFLGTVGVAYIYLWLS
jgi:hypothetical protein